MSGVFAAGREPGGRPSATAAVATSNPKHSARRLFISLRFAGRQPPAAADAPGSLVAIIAAPQRADLPASSGAEGSAKHPGLCIVTGANAGDEVRGGKDSRRVRRGRLPGNNEDAARALVWRQRQDETTAECQGIQPYQGHMGGTGADVDHIG